jgi:energy-coupling factor transporter ATP-binding protein EcfA2
MIILISGTNGSGKTTLVRRLIELMPEPTEETKIYTRRGDFAVLGKYDGNACGGCDKFSWKGAADDLEAELVRLVEAGVTPILEGSIVSTWGLKRLERLIPHGLVIIQLTTSVEECERRVNARRLEKRGPEKYTPVNPKNLVAKHGGLVSILPKRRALGVDVRERNNEEAFIEARNLLGI